MAKGKVKWFDEHRGFGLIEKQGGEEVFVHYSCIAGEGFKTLLAGQEVEFDLYEGQKGPIARNVMKR